MLKRFRDVAGEKMIRDVQKAVEQNRMKLAMDRRRKLRELREQKHEAAQEIDYLNQRIQMYQDMLESFPAESADHQREILRMKNRITFLLR
jgi:hypothetical protein